MCRHKDGYDYCIFDMGKCIVRKIDISEIRLIDMHTHLYDIQSEGVALSEIEYRNRSGIFSVYCAKNPVEWDFLKKLGCQSVSEMAMLSFGIHPWESAKYDPDEYEDIYKSVSIIGEIGLDSVWTDIPLDIQRRVFREQLEIASSLKKPVILHTKGCESEIAEMLRGFDQPVLIHWYSGSIDVLRSFIERGCYFTLGPDAYFQETDNGLINAMLSLVPRERLLTETDGLESIFWTQERYPELQNTLYGHTFDKNDQGSGKKDYFPMIYGSLYSTAKRIADYDSVDIKSTVAQNISALMEFVGTDAVNGGKCLIIAGGEPCSMPAAEDFSLIIAVDKGMEYAKEAGIMPDILIGDFDSVDPLVLEEAGNSLSVKTIILPEHKNDSDLQSAVKHALEQGFKELVICCVMGGRLDHMIANLQVASYAVHRGATCHLIGENDEAFVFSNKIMFFPRREGFSFSVFALSDRCEGVDISGARYTVSGFSLTNNLSRGLSNEWASDQITISVKKGVLAVILSKL